ncbi:hypothetical protein L484_020790 [Morus notabilis]|uniref:Uncharacterized protein n=1 Tax=Morus notabilis TaxID=981085 RepID=W9S5Q6_9ROSA|nr:hypothetical protein L484_020790 [Morus notabilis]
MAFLIIAGGSSYRNKLKSSSTSPEDSSILTAWNGFSSEPLEPYQEDISLGIVGEYPRISMAVEPVGSLDLVFMSELITPTDDLKISRKREAKSFQQ